MLTILYFAALRELMGISEETLELPADVCTVRDLVGYLQRARPALSGKLASVRIALDETFAAESDSLAGAQVAALIPPVAGG